jgi:aminoglycoside phosphotransferase (APT) family kinase protein
MTYPDGWNSSTRTLATLSLLDPSKLGLDNFASCTPYFPRQIKSLSKVSMVQSKAVDIETNEPVGPIPYFEDMITWYQNHLPDETKTGLRIVHGDYKMDNVIFHPTESRIIGILDWCVIVFGQTLYDTPDALLGSFVLWEVRYVSD